MDEAELMLRLMAAAQQALRKIPASKLPGLLKRCGRARSRVAVTEAFKQAEPGLLASRMCGPVNLNGPRRSIPIGRFVELRHEAIRLTLQVALKSETAEVT